MSATPSLSELTRELRSIADAYDHAQQVRVQAGESIRAVLRIQRPDGSDSADAHSPEAVLSAIRRGEQDGPSPLLGRTYRQQWIQEQEMAKQLAERLEQHPAWPWLKRVPGLGSALAGKLVARLDVTRAETPSAFWAYCGLATVPGVEYRCASCGFSACFPERSRVPSVHVRPGDSRPCRERLVPGGRSGVRVAQPKPERGKKAAYDRHAKKICYLIGNSLIHSGGAFQTFYQRERAKLEETRPGWADQQRHLTALRKTEKLFLAHLWVVWRQALDLPITRPHAAAPEENEGWTDPWKMVVAPRSQRWSRGQPVSPARPART